MTIFAVARPELAFRQWRVHAVGTRRRNRNGILKGCRRMDLAPGDQIAIARFSFRSSKPLISR